MVTNGDLTDATLLAEELGKEREANKRLREENNGLAYRVSELKKKLMWGKFFFRGMVILAACFVLSVGGFFLWRVINAEETSHCYIKTKSIMTTGYAVYRSIDWYPDRELGYSTELDKANEIAHKSGCKMTSERKNDR